MGKSRFLPLVFVTGALGLVWSSGCSEDVKPRKQAVLRSSLQPGAAGTAKCRYGPPATWVELAREGDSGNDLPIPDGENNARIACRVARSGDGFDVDAQVQVFGGENGGTVSIKGHFTASGPQSSIRAVYQKGDVGTFEQNDCTAQYTQSYMGIAAGRVWAELDCPKMVFSAQDRECRGTANFRFENCDQ
jgi:hypothetical protein